LAAAAPPPEGGSRSRGAVTSGSAKGALWGVLAHGGADTDARGVSPRRHLVAAATSPAPKALNFKTAAKPVAASASSTRPSVSNNCSGSASTSGGGKGVSSWRVGRHDGASASYATVFRVTELPHVSSLQSLCLLQPRSSSRRLPSRSRRRPPPLQRPMATAP